MYNCCKWRCWVQPQRAYRHLQYTDLVDEVVQQAVCQLLRVAALVEATHLQLMLQLSLQRSARTWVHQHTANSPTAVESRQTALTEAEGHWAVSALQKTHSDLPWRAWRAPGGLQAASRLAADHHPRLAFWCSASEA
jgi:hypothetical protein